MYDKPDDARGNYAWQKRAFEELGQFNHDVRAEKCVQCRECEEKCPQAIPISEWIPIAPRALRENSPFRTGVETGQPNLRGEEKAIHHGTGL